MFAFLVIAVRSRCLRPLNIQASQLAWAKGPKFLFNGLIFLIYGPVWR